MTETSNERLAIPRSKENDYTPDAARARQDFVRERTGTALEDVSSDSFDPETTRGNVEHFNGVAQVPLGIAGPLLSTVSTPRASSTSPWPRPRGRSSPPTTAA
jgi:hydroxymethylglutaryl-CoA reductase